MQKLQEITKRTNIYSTNVSSFLPWFDTNNGKNATLFEFAENVATRHTVKEIEKKITKENEEK